MSLFSWLAQLMCSKGMPASVAGWDTGVNWGRLIQGDLYNQLEIELEKKGGLQ